MRDIKDHASSHLRFAMIWEEYESIRHPEDGNLMFGMVVWLQATTAEGVRFRKLVGYSDWRVEVSHGDPICVRTQDPDVLRRAGAKAAERLERLPTPRLDPTTWDYAGCVYGSEAYVALGCEADAAAEERKDLGASDSARY